jgi:hypothetical protein
MVRLWGQQSFLHWLQILYSFHPRGFYPRQVNSGAEIIFGGTIDIQQTTKLKISTIILFPATELCRLVD